MVKKNRRKLDSKKVYLLRFFLEFICFFYYLIRVLFFKNVVCILK